MAMGRPTHYKPEFCESVLGWGAEGKSRTWMAGKLGTTRQSLYEWEAAHPDFAYAIKRALTLSQMWWEDAGQEGLGGDRFNDKVWARSMGARFPEEWREKAETTVNAGEGFSEILAIAGAGGVFPKKGDDAAE